MRCIGILREPSPVRVAAVGGLAYLGGIVATLLVCNTLLILGAPFTLLTFGLVALALAMPFLLWLPQAVRLTWPRPSLRGMDFEGWFAVATLAAVGLVAIAALLSVRDSALTGYDAWNLWARKALFLFREDTYPADAFRGSAYGVIHPDYPLLLPLLEAVHLKAAAVDRPGAVLSVFPPLLVAFAWSGAFLASRVTRPALWAALLGTAALTTTGDLLSGYADVPLAYLLCLAALALGLWLERGERSDLLLGTLLLGGAALMKNEGIGGALLMLIVAGAGLALQRGWPRLRELVAAATALVLLSILPWQLWLRAKDFHGDLPVLQGLAPGFLADRWDRVEPSVEALFATVTGNSFPELFVPLGLALAVLWGWGRHRALAPGFYMASAVAYFGSLVWAYWISPLGLDFHLQTSVSRVAVGVAFIALAGVLHLSSAAGRGEPSGTPRVPASATPGDAV